MPEPFFDPTQPDEWKSVSDCRIADARAMQRDGRMLMAVYFCCYSIEMALKGLLTARQLRVPHNHDISNMIDLLDDIPLRIFTNDSAKIFDIQRMKNGNAEKDFTILRYQSDDSLVEDIDCNQLVININNARHQILRKMASANDRRFRR